MTRSTPFTSDRVAYRGYLVRWSVFTLAKDSGRVWVEKDGHLICWANTVEQAKGEVDNLLAAPVAICSWCPDAKEKTDAATAKGTLVTHGVCKDCAAKVVAS